MLNLNYFVVDAFTDTPLADNPLAVVSRVRDVRVADSIVLVAKGQLFLP